MTPVSLETLISAAFGSRLVPCLIESVLKEAGRQFLIGTENVRAAAEFVSPAFRIDIRYSASKILVVLVANVDGQSAPAEICALLGVNLKHQFGYSIETDFSLQPTGHSFTARATIAGADLP